MRTIKNRQSQRILILKFYDVTCKPRIGRRPVVSLIMFVRSARHASMCSDSTINILDKKCLLVSHISFGIKQYDKAYAATSHRGLATQFSPSDWQELNCVTIQGEEMKPCTIPPDWHYHGQVLALFGIFWSPFCVRHKHSSRIFTTTETSREQTLSYFPIYNFSTNFFSLP